MIAKIIVDNKSKQVDKPFDYLVPKELEGKIKIGSRVLVPFSSGNREIEGFCVGTADTSDNGTSFVVQPIFKEKSFETLGSVLLRLMTSSE